MTALSLPERPRLPPHAVARPVSAVESERRDATFLGCLEEAQESLRLGDVAQSLRLARSARSIPGYERSEAALTLWDEICTLLPRKGLQSAWEEASLEGHADPVLCLAVSADGGRALSGSMDGTVRLWDLGTRQLLATFEGHESTVAAVAFSADGRRAISGSWDRTLKVWDLATGAVLRTMSGHAEYVSGLALSPDGATRAVGELGPDAAAVGRRERAAARRVRGAHLERERRRLRPGRPLRGQRRLGCDRARLGRRERAARRASSRDTRAT